MKYQFNNNQLVRFSLEKSVFLKVNVFYDSINAGFDLVWVILKLEPIAIKDIACNFRHGGAESEPSRLKTAECRGVYPPWVMEAFPPGRNHTLKVAGDELPSIPKFEGG